MAAVQGSALIDYTKWTNDELMAERMRIDDVLRQRLIGDPQRLAFTHQVISPTNTAGHPASCICYLCMAP